MTIINKPIGHERQALPNKLSHNSAKLNGKDDNKQLLKAAKDFTAIFFDTMLQSMRKSVSKSQLLGGGHAEGMYQSMLDSEYAKLMAERDQSGLAQVITRQLSELGKVRGRSQEQQQKATGIKAYQLSGPKRK